MEKRERVARAIATAVTQGGDPDIVVVREPLARTHGGFTVIPPAEWTAPLWMFFQEAADAAIAEAERPE